MPYAAGLAEDERIHRMHCNKKVVPKPIQFTVSREENEIGITCSGLQIVYETAV